MKKHWLYNKKYYKHSANKINPKEFGMHNGEMYLGDEFSPDGCRIWDSKTKEKLDKDRFRQGLGGVVENYQIIAERLGIVL